MKKEKNGRRVHLCNKPEKGATKVPKKVQQKRAAKTARKEEVTAFGPAEDQAQENQDKETESSTALVVT